MFSFFIITTFFQDATASSDLDALGLYLLVSLVFVILALVEFAFVALLSRVANPVENQIHEEKADKKTNENIETPERKEAPNRQGSFINLWMKGLEKTQYQKKVKPFSNMPPIQVIDVISFFLFAFLFVVFNIIYWIIYLM